MTGLERANYDELLDRSEERPCEVAGCPHAGGWTTEDGDTLCVEEHRDMWLRGGAVALRRSARGRTS